jgi:hypothetical protein
LNTGKYGIFPVNFHTGFSILPGHDSCEARGALIVGGLLRKVFIGEISPDPQLCRAPGMDARPGYRTGP